MIITSAKEEAIKKTLDNIDKKVKELKEKFPVEQYNSLVTDMSELLSLVNEFGGYSGEPGTHPDRSRCEFNMWSDAHGITSRIETRANDFYFLESSIEKHMRDMHRWLEDNHKYKN